jgi:DedD protein
MGLLSIFQRRGQAAGRPTKTDGAGRAGRPTARQAPANAAAAVDTAEAVRDARARARRRLMGATVLLLIGVIGFPLLFETQPRPIPVDLPIEIPARGGPDAIAPLHLARVAPSAAANALVASPAVAEATPPADARSPAPTSAPVSPEPIAVPAASHPAAAASAVQARAYVSPAMAHAGRRDTVAPASTASPSVASRPAAPAPSPPSPAHASTAAPAAHPASTTPHAAPAHAAAASEHPAPAAVASAGDASEPASAGARFVVQIAAYTDEAKMRETRNKVDKLGLKTYTQAVDTPSGKRVRVRVGPFPSKAEADRAAARIRADGLPAAVLSL